MKYLVSWTFRSYGSAAENEAATERLLAVYSKWTPHDGTTFHQFLSRLDASGGYAVVETDNPMDLLEDASKFNALCEYQVEAVVDIAESVRAAQEGIEFLKSV